MKRITTYQTQDGQTFTDKLAAKIHETELEVERQINAEYEPIFRAAPDVKRLVTAMLAYPQFFIDALEPLAKAHAKSRAKAQQAVAVA
jgi:hypothetical protein